MEMPQGGIYSLFATFSVLFYTRHVIMTLVLQVRWDETSNTPRPDRVSPWKIEPALTPLALNPLSMPRPKRSRPNAVPSSPDSSVLTREGMIICY